MAHGTCDYPGCTKDAYEEDLSTGVEKCIEHLLKSYISLKPGAIVSWYWLASDGWTSNLWEDHPLPSTLVDRLKNGWKVVARLNNGQKVVFKCLS